MTDDHAPSHEEIYEMAVEDKEEEMAELSAPVVAVKPLVWGDGLIATPTPYQIWEDNGASGASDDPYIKFENYRVFEPFLMNCVGDEYETLPEAKAAAQAHHDAYILSQVEAQPTWRGMDEIPTDSQMNDACLSFRHDYGLLNDAQQEELQSVCREWWRCISRALPTPPSEVA